MGSDSLVSQTSLDKMTHYYLTSDCVEDHSIKKILVYEQ